MLDSKYLYGVIIVLIILLSTLTLSTVLGGHEDPDEAEEDVAEIIKTLSRTKEDIERSLEEALWVNYTVDWDENGTLSESYLEEHLNSSNEIAVDREEELSIPEAVLSEIEGVVESSWFLENYYVPFYLLSSNLTRYTKRHRRLISNLTRVTEMIQGSENLSDLELRNETIGEMFINSHHHLDRMEEDILPDIEKNRESIDEDLFDLRELDRLIEDNYDLIDEYRELLKIFEGEIPSTLMIYGPEKGHPGSEVDIYGYFVHEGDFVTNATIFLNISTENNDQMVNISTSEGYYEYPYKVNWSQEIDTDITFSAMVEADGEKIRSRNLTVDIVPYPSNIVLDTEQDAYYNETIEITGELKTDPDLNVSGTRLKTTITETVSVDERGEFELSSESREFRWGTTEVEVRYDGAVYLFSLSRTEYEEYLEEDPINETLREAFGSEDHDVEEDANLSKVEGKWFISEDETRRYRIEIGEENLHIYDAENKTIAPSSGVISFEVSIPTEIVELEYPEVIEEEEIDEFGLSGRLVNGSSGEGMDGQTLDVLLDDLEVGSIETGDEGYFTFSFSDDHELESGQYVLNIYFDGTEIFREVRSEDIPIEILGEEREDEGEFWRSYTFLGIIAVLLGSVLIIFYILVGKEEEEKTEKTIEKKIMDPASKISVPSASSSNEIPTTYRNFLDILQGAGLINVSRGKTHQEIEDEINSHPKLEGFEDHVTYITDRFEKVLFKEKNISTSEIEKFNSYISRLTKEVSA